MTKVAIVEDDTRIRESIAAVINGTHGFTLTGAYSSGEVALKKIPGDWPNVLIMDIQLPGMSGIECVAKLKEMNHCLLALMFTVDDDSDAIFKSLQAGATGYLLKSGLRTEMLDAIHNVHIGRRHLQSDVAAEIALHVVDDSLTEREIAVLRLVAVGKANKEIARALSLSDETVKAHLKSIFAKLDVADRTHAVTVAARRGIIEL